MSHSPGSAAGPIQTLLSYCRSDQLQCCRAPFSCCAGAPGRTSAEALLHWWTSHSWLWLCPQGLGASGLQVERARDEWIEGRRSGVSGGEMLQQLKLRAIRLLVFGQEDWIKLSVPKILIYLPLQIYEALWQPTLVWWFSAGQKNIEYLSFSFYLFSFIF